MICSLLRDHPLFQVKSMICSFSNLINMVGKGTIVTEEEAILMEEVGVEMEMDTEEAEVTGSQRLPKVVGSTSKDGKRRFSSDIH
uniref:Uncharacterized protein n=1 Tax=Nelumbo nucifera TaxID=4432 RepID=A0A822YQ90_NELNU|nr:TPA_asm: hypothetical protein HUJ06_012046 [Nelumbo nucifera]